MSDEINTLANRWIHKEKQRYYYVMISQDLLGDWIVTKSWGSLKTSAGRIVYVACSSIMEAKILVKKIENTRKNHGYVLT